MFLNARFFLVFLIVLLAEMCQESIARRCSVKTRDQQCKEVYPHSGGFCDPQYMNQILEDRCKKLYCAFPFRGSFFLLQHIKPDEGTYCAFMSACHEGQCVSVENLSEMPEYEHPERNGESCFSASMYETLRDVERRAV